MDKQVGQQFDERLEKKTFKLESECWFSAFRLQIDGILGGTGPVQLGNLELIGDLIESE